MGAEIGFVMRQFIKRFMPGFALNFYRRAFRVIEDIKNARRTTEDVFGEIYKKNKWGGKRGELNSGSGSDDDIVVPYVEMLESLSKSEGFSGLTLVDLGCGDFRVGRKILPLCRTYIGVDIVRPVVDRNNRLYGTDSTKFVHLNIIDDTLPDGDVCTIRQVLQHLSNDQIVRIVGKLEKYKWVIITEHHPSDGGDIILNVDKPHGGGIRADFNSGVYLLAAPFNLPADNVREVLQVPARARSDGKDAGVIKTFLYKPRAAWV